jgi:hypothetical protein
MKIKNKCSWKLTDGIILLYNNASPQVTERVQDQLNAMLQWEVLKHPAQSPHLPPYNFHVFGPLNKALKCHKFMLDDVQKSVVQWFRQQPNNSLQMGYANLCINGTPV